jgi:cytochrome c553
MKSRIVVLIAAALPMAVACAADDGQVRTWAAACAACHGPKGKSEGGMPSLAGHDATKLATEMKAFRAGKRSGTVMPRLMKGYSEAEIEAIAAFWAKGGVR